MSTKNSENIVLSEKAKAFTVDALLGNSESKDDAPSNFLQKPSGIRDVSKKVDISSEEKTKVKLLNRSLWLEFHRIGNEMIITKAGRRIFPTLKYEIYNLKPNAYYIIWLDVVPIDKHRYRYAFPNSRWMVAGRCEPQTSNNKFLHHDGVATGSHWMGQSIAFDKVKLTNNKEPQHKGQIILNSMHKYQPRLHIQSVEGPNDRKMDEHQSEQFIFQETSFITVTAYQNQQITNLKIQSNPFAKGFRDAIKTRHTIENGCSETENNFNLSAFSPISTNNYISDSLCRPYVLSNCSSSEHNVSHFEPSNLYQCCNCNINPTQCFLTNNRSVLFPSSFFTWNDIYK